MCVCVCVCVCLYMCGHVCMLKHAYLTAFVCVYQTDSLINLSLWAGSVDLGCHGDGNQAGPGRGL